MFTPKQIKELMDARPFQPFRVHLSDGKSYDVKNHDGAMVGRTSVEIGINPDEDGIIERSVHCSLLHITRIEKNLLAA